MMGGLAYMTGRPGDPLRAGTSRQRHHGRHVRRHRASLGALIQRGISGRGMEVQSALFENNVFLVGQHMLQYAITGKPAAPMPARDQPVGDLRRVHRQGRRADLPRRGQRRAVADVLRRARLRRPEGRPGAEAEQRPRAARARRCSPTARERLQACSAAELSRRFEARRPAVRADQEARGPARRSAPARPPAAWPTSRCPTATRPGRR